MKPAESLDAFVRAPRDHWTAGPTWLHFCHQPTLWGVVLWGWPAEDHVSRLVHSLRAELAKDAVPHASVVDARALEQADPGAFGVFEAYVRDHFEALRTRVTRLALVRPAGLQGAVVAGFFQVLKAPYPVRVWDTLPEALAWLGVAEPGAVTADVEDARARASGTPPVVSALRAWLGAHLPDATPAAAATALATSQRTLQRRLSDAGTSFQQELAAARIREAQRRMLATRDPLTAIAVDVGFASLAHFSSAFRDAVGQPPSQWRNARAARD